MSERLWQDLYPAILTLFIALIGLVGAGIAALTAIIKKKSVESQNLYGQTLRDTASMVVKATEQDSKANPQIGNSVLHEAAAATVMNILPKATEEQVNAAVKSGVFDINQERGIE